MTPDELDWLAEVAADVRATYLIARSRVLSWEPAPPPLPGKAAAAHRGGGG